MLITAFMLEASTYKCEVTLDVKRVREMCPSSMACSRLS